MNVFSRKRLFVWAVAIVGLMIIVGQTSALAQPTLKQQAFSGGYFQVVDTAEAPCTGQCAIANWQTAACTCAPNYALVQVARTLISVGTGPEGSVCGATIFTCVLPAE